MMKMKRLFCTLLVSGVMICNLGLTAMAAHYSDDVIDLNSMEQGAVVCSQMNAETDMAPRATNQFEITVAARSTVAANSSFSLESGETVTINASYSPGTASVDFGLIAPDGLFHYINTTSGSINRTIRVDERGSYTFAVRNNSSRTVSVVGFINY